MQGAPPVLTQQILPKVALVLLILVTNLPPVSTTPVACHGYGTAGGKFDTSGKY
jgi:hypothetical protein